MSTPTSLPPPPATLLVGSVFVVVSLVGSHSPQLRHVPVAVAGPAAVTRQVEARVAASAPGAYWFRDLGSATAAGRALRGGRRYAVVDLTGAPTIRYAGAQEPTTTQARRLRAWGHWPRWPSASGSWPRWPSPPWLLARAGETLIALMLCLVASATVLAPQPSHASSGELLAEIVRQGVRGASDEGLSPETADG